MTGIVDFSGFLTPLVQRLVDFIPDPTDKAKAQAAATQQMLAFVSSQNLAQDTVNTAEASNASLFVAGWRPFIGWIGGASLAWVFIISPLLSGLLSALSSTARIPTIDTTQLIELVFALLGLGGMRTYEKATGVAAPGVH